MKTNLQRAKRSHTVIRIQLSPKNLSRSEQLIFSKARRDVFQNKYLHLMYNWFGKTILEINACLSRSNVLFLVKLTHHR